MTKREATTACKLLEANDYRETEVIKSDSSWVVFATANNGYRVKFESLTAVEGRIEELAFYRAAYA
jgi:hypothetical protein